MALFDLARMTVSSSGTGTITLNAAVSGFLTFDQAGCSVAAAGQRVTYAISDTANSEIGHGTYTSTSLSLTRTPLKSTNGGSAISMSNAAQVFITPAAEDLIDNGKITVCSSTQTFTPNANTIFAIVETIGAGGGGGAGGVSAATQVSVGGGGGAGGYCRSLVLSSAIGASQTVTVSSVGGSGGTAGGTGTAGSSTTFGVIVQSNGGSGGAGGSAGTVVVSAGGAGATVGTGTVSISGGSGFPGMGVNQATFGVSMGGGGAASPFGGGGSGGSNAGGGNSAGGTGSPYGTGGGGSATSSAAGANGGPGGGGVCIITEFYGQ